MTRAAAFGLVGLALVAGCKGSASRDGSGSNSSDAGAPSGAQPVNAAAGTSANASMAAGTGAATFDAGRSKALVDAGAVVRKHWPSCDAGAGAIDDADAGESPYADTCLLDEQHGVFVDATHGDDDRADGSRDFPFKTLGAAIRLAVNAHKSVYACAGVYEERMLIGTELTNGLEVYGSFSCATFLPDPSAGRSLVRAKGKGSALAISKTRDVIVAGFDFENIANDAAAPEPGTSYVGALVESAQRVVLRDVTLHAARGEPGRDGAAPKAASTGATAGSDGANACSAELPMGGAGGVSVGCTANSQNTGGGNGGNGGVGTGNGGIGYWFGFPQGGQGDTGSGWSCTAGSGLGPVASDGYQGGNGAGASGFGALISGGFVGFSGQAGGDGSPGLGGAGGGGARAPSSCSGLTMPSGASGGGGGAGGCGGAGGKAGGPGGSSFGLIAIDSRIYFEGGSITIGDGGRGGRGAMGQLGGKGGLGGHGGKGSSGSNAGCDGGPGGKGGPGGPGGGGNGGHAIGVLYVGKMPSLTGVAGETAFPGLHAGEGGLPPADADPMLSKQLTGSAGTVGFTYQF